MLLIHPRIHTMSPRLSTPHNPLGTVSALRILHGRVCAAGDAHTLQRFRDPNEPVHHPEGACIFPGMIDTHAHVTPLTQRPVSLYLDPKGSLHDTLHALQTFARNLPKDTWIIAEGWDQSAWSPHPLLDARGFPTASLLDQAIPHHPAYLIRKDHHAAWVNTQALQRAHLSSQTPDPEGGSVLRDPTGHPTGVLIDTATDLVEDLLPPPSEDDLRAHITHTAQRFLQHGVTTAHCALVRPEHIALCRTLLHGPEPTVALRIRAMVFDRPDPLQDWARTHSPEVDPWQRWATVALKTFADGALGSRGAWMLSPYTDDPSNYGAPLFSPSSIEAICNAAVPNQWQMATHAIGSRAIRETLHAYRNAAQNAQDPNIIKRLKWRIEHVQHLHPSDLPLLQDLGVYAAMQPIHATQDMDICTQRLGPLRTQHAYPLHTIHNANIPLALGSDYPIETLCPLAGIHAAITRQRPDHTPPEGFTPHNRLTRLQALRGYTTDAARFCTFDTHTLGHLDLGAHADWISLTEDLAHLPPERIPSARILQTASAGRVVYSSSPLPTP